MRAAVIVPAYQAATLVGPVVAELVALWPEPDAIFAVDDGSTDDTAEQARRAGARVLRHPTNRGKGVALRTGMKAALEAGFMVGVTVDADGQHPPGEALRMHQTCTDPNALVLGVRDLAGAGAPRANQLSNAFSNLALSFFVGRWLHDTQCGLRRYPLEACLALGAADPGYAYEAEIVVRAALAGLRIEQPRIEVRYPPEEQRLSHFDAVRDPARIVARVLRTVTAMRSQQLLAWARGPRARGAHGG